MLLLLAALAQAGEPQDGQAQEEPVRVLVSEFQARNADAKALAALVENFIAARLKANPQIQLVRPEDLPPFEDYPARIYLEGCPPGDIVGCTYVAADRGGVAWAITGTTRVLPGSSKVTIEILDIQTGRVVVSFESELESGEDEKFAEAVAQVLSNAMGGSFQERDLREGEEPEEGADGLSHDVIASQLESLSSELGELSTVVSRPDTIIRPPAYTLDDLSEQMREEGTKPWERLQMTPGEYLRYKNSGMPLLTWRERALGRHGQLLIRPAGGFASQPTYATYYGRYAYDGSAVVDSFAAHAVQNGFGARGSIGLAWGLSPLIDAGLDVGTGTGTMGLDIQQQTVGQQPLPADQEEYPSSTLIVGPRVTAAFLPVSPVRPTVSGAVQFWFGDKIDNHVLPPEDLTLFTAPVLVVAEIAPGAEFRLNRNLDLFLQIPIDLAVAGRPYIDSRTGSTEVITGLNPPEAGGIVTAGIRAGLQIHLFGKKVESSILDDLEEP